MGAKDDFWMLFLNMWTLAVGFISQGLFIYIPGKDQQNFYVCTGRVPAEFVEAQTKKNNTLIVTTYVSLIIHLVTFIRK